MSQAVERTCAGENVFRAGRNATHTDVAEVLGVGGELAAKVLAHGGDVLENKVQEVVDKFVGILEAELALLEAADLGGGDLGGDLKRLGSNCQSKHNRDGMHWLQQVNA
jgi:hypothetical protein